MSSQKSKLLKEKRLIYTGNCIQSLGFSENNTERILPFGFSRNSEKSK